MNVNLDMLKELAHSELLNYIIPGVTSSLIGNQGDRGTVRLFECSRNHQESVAPHSHRFNFQALILKGSVINRTWFPTSDNTGDMYMMTELVYQGKPGEYICHNQDVERWDFKDAHYKAGDWYAMDYTEVHSIAFSKDAAVLIFEGPLKRPASIVLQPFVDGRVIPTAQVQPWMFKKRS